MEKRFDKRTLIRVAVTGPESTGKTTLAESLSEYFGVLWVPEYAREYLDNINHPYNEGDVENIARGQLKNEDEYAENSDKLLISDTDLVVIKIWMEVRYGYCPQWILQEIINRPYDLRLLCFPDIPWTYDKLREHPDLREHLFDLYKKTLDFYKLPYLVIMGTKEQRLNTAVFEIEKILNPK